MSKILVWDIPMRVFHWAFALSLTSALCFSLLVDEDHPLFQLHMLLGIVAVFLFCLRVILGVVGSRYARFTSYPLRPAAIVSYMAKAFTRGAQRYPGNNPGSALAAVLMFVLVPLLWASGAEFGREVLGEAHEFCAYALLGVLAMHLLGIAWHTVRHRENIALAMISGKKAGQAADAIGSANTLWGLALLIGAGVWIGTLFSNHNSKAANVRLPLTGITVQLGEHGSPTGGRRERRHDDHD